MAPRSFQHWSNNEDHDLYVEVQTFLLNMSNKYSRTKEAIKHRIVKKCITIGNTKSDKGTGSINTNCDKSTNCNMDEEEIMNGDEITDDEQVMREIFPWLV